MLTLKIMPGKKVNLYLRIEHGEKLLGSVVVKPRFRVGFDFSQEVRVVRDEVDDRPAKAEGSAA